MKATFFFSFQASEVHRLAALAFAYPRRPQFNRDLQTQSRGKVSRNGIDYDIDNDIDNNTDSSIDNDVDNENDMGSVCTV
jgi:hypothetical protein